MNSFEKKSKKNINNKKIANITDKKFRILNRSEINEISGGKCGATLRYTYTTEAGNDYIGDFQCNF